MRAAARIQANMATYKKNRHYRGAEGKASRASKSQIKRGRMAAHMQEIMTERKPGASGAEERMFAPLPMPRKKSLRQPAAEKTHSAAM